MDIDTLNAVRGGIIAVKSPDLDPSTTYGRGMAGLLGEFDAMESEVKPERVAAVAADRIRAGKPNGGLGYGWTRDALGEWVVEESEAAIVREVTDRLLAGLRVHDRSLPDETTSEGTRQIIVPRDRWERGAAKFAPDPRCRSTARPGARRHMLTYSEAGARGVCGAQLRVGTMNARKSTQSDQMSVRSEWTKGDPETATTARRK